MRQRLLVGTVLVSCLLAACSDDDADPPEATAPTVREGSEQSIQTVPAITGTVVVTIGEQRFEGEISNCVIDPEADAVDFVAAGTSSGEPVRIEHGQSTAGLLAVFIGVSNPLDPGEVSWVGDPDFEISNGAASAAEFTMTRSTDQTEAPATATVECGSEG